MENLSAACSLIGLEHAAAKVLPNDLLWNSDGWCIVQVAFLSTPIVSPGMQPSG
jgi:hypothetical protein